MSQLDKIKNRFASPTSRKRGLSFVGQGKTSEILREMQKKREIEKMQKNYRKSLLLGDKISTEKLRLELAFDDLNKKAENQEKLIKNHEKSISELKKVNETLEEKFRSQKENFELSKIDLQSMNRQLTSYKQDRLEIERLLENNNVLRKKLRTVEASNREVKSELEKFTSANAGEGDTNQKSEVRELTKVITNLKKKYEALKTTREDEKVAFRVEMNEVERQFREKVSNAKLEYTKSLRDRETENDSLRRELEKLKNKFLKKKKVFEEYNREKNGITDLLVSTNQEINKKLNIFEGSVQKVLKEYELKIATKIEPKLQRIQERARETQRKIREKLTVATENLSYEKRRGATLEKMLSNAREIILDRNSEVKNLQSKLVSLEKKISDTDLEMERLKITINNFEKFEISSKHQLDKVRRRKSQLKVQLDAKQSNLMDITNQLAELTKENVKLRTEYEEKIKKILRDGQGGITDVTEKCRQLEVKLKSREDYWEAHVREKRNEIEILKLKIKNFESFELTEKERIVFLEKLIDGKSQEIKNLNLTIRELQEKVKELKTRKLERVSLGQPVVTSTVVVGSSKSSETEKTEVNQSESLNSSRVDFLTSKNEILGSKLDVLQKILKNKENKIIRLTEENSKNGILIESSKKNLVKKKGIIKSLTSLLRNGKGIIDNQKKKIVGLEKVKDGLEGSKSDLESKLKRVNKKIHNLNAIIFKLKNEKKKFDEWKRKDLEKLKEKQKLEFLKKISVMRKVINSQKEQLEKLKRLKNEIYLFDIDEIRIFKNIIKNQSKKIKDLQGNDREKEIERHVFNELKIMKSVVSSQREIIQRQQLEIEEKKKQIEDIGETKYQSQIRIQKNIIKSQREKIHILENL